MQDTTHLIKELNTTARTIHSHKPHPMTYSTLITLPRDLKLKTPGQPFILDDSKGFTRAGVERINNSIQTYCWAILGSQSQTRTVILGTGTAFDAQKQFLTLIEDAINKPIDLPNQIVRYQNILKYAKKQSRLCLWYGVVYVTEQYGAANRYIPRLQQQNRNCY